MVKKNVSYSNTLKKKKTKTNILNDNFFLLANEEVRIVQEKKRVS